MLFAFMKQPQMALMRQNRYGTLTLATISFMSGGKRPNMCQMSMNILQIQTHGSQKG